jgi:hypothetical protein
MSWRYIKWPSALRYVTWVTSSVHVVFVGYESINGSRPRPRTWRILENFLFNRLIESVHQVQGGRRERPCKVHWVRTPRSHSLKPRGDEDKRKRKIQPRVRSRKPLLAYALDTNEPRFERYGWDLPRGTRVRRERSRVHPSSHPRLISLFLSCGCTLDPLIDALGELANG